MFSSENPTLIHIELIGYKGHSKRFKSHPDFIFVTHICMGSNLHETLDGKLN